LTALEFQDLTIAFENKAILKNFSATINHGQFIGILGPNGAGKSTFLRAILGLVKPISGHILVCEKPAQRGHPCIGYMAQAQHESQAFPLTGRSYLAAALNGTGWGMPFLTKPQRMQIERVIALVGLEEYVDRPVTQYSGGERQRLALAQSLLGQPKILLLDEPLSSLDPGQNEKIVSLVRSIQKELNITILLTSHNINPLIGTIDHIIYLAHGKAAIGSVDEIVNNKTLSALYDTPIEVIKSDGNVWVLQKNSGMSIHDRTH